MASRETTPDGGSGPGASVRRAAAVAAPAEEPATGLFPAPATTPATAPASGSAAASPSTEEEAERPGTGTGTGIGRKSVDPDGTSSAAVPTTSGGTAAPASSTTTPPTTSPASAESSPAVSAPAPDGAVTTSGAAASGATAPGGGEGTARAEGATGSRVGAMSAVRARLATAARAAGPGSGAGSGRNTEGSEPGRPNKPLIAAAVLCGLALVAVPFLISDSEEKPRKAAAKGADGSPMNTDPLGQGLVPGEERLAVPGGAKGGPAAPGKSGAAGVRGPGTGPARGPGLAGLSGLPGLGPVAGPQDGGIAVPPGSAGGPASGGGPAAKAPAAPGKKDPATTNPGTGSSGKGSSGTKNPGTKAPTAPATKTPAKSNPPKTSPAAPPPAPATYSHLIGLGCNTAGFATGDWYEDKKEGWLKHWGSTKSNGCNGLFYSMPMSGSSKSDGIWAQWKFYTGKVEKGLCAVRVYIPNVGDNDYVGGTPAHYTVYRAFTQKSSNQIGTFRINQPSRLGQWVDAGTYRISGGKISVVLDNRGSGADNRHAAAAPVRVDCTAS